MADGTSIRVARPGDTAAIVALVNEAYRVESFFVQGNRVEAPEIRELTSAGELLVAEQDGQVVACVHVSVRGEGGYFGMLAVHPRVQGQGVGHRLIAAAEARGREAGARRMDIKVVNLRTDLLPLYQRLGYLAIGTEPYTHRSVLRPCHFILMTKLL